MTLQSQSCRGQEVQNTAVSQGVSVSGATATSSPWLPDPCQGPGLVRTVPPGMLLSESSPGRQNQEAVQICRFTLFSEEEVGEGGCTPLQYSCLENPMNGGAW